MNEIENIFQKHSLASEAEINEEKTEIFRLGEPHKAESEYFKSKIKTKVKILGAIFCTDKSVETKDNLKKPLEKLRKWNTEYTGYISIVGKILRINTYIYSTIYNNAWIINTKCKHFREMIQEIAKYLQRIKQTVSIKKERKKKED